MSNFTLSGRLEIITRLASEGPEELTFGRPDGAVIADIGTDHGYVPIKLLEEGLYTHTLMCDIRKGPLEKAKEHARAEGLSEGCCEFRLGGGLEILERSEADCVVIAGMGGEIIRNILDLDANKSRSYKRFVIQPRKHPEYVRRWLVDNNFFMLNESFCIENGRFCQIFSASPKKGISCEIFESEFDYEYAPALDLLPDKELVRSYFRSQIRMFSKMSERIAQSEDPSRDAEKASLVSARLSYLNERLKRNEQ